MDSKQEKYLADAMADATAEREEMEKNKKLKEKSKMMMRWIHAEKWRNAMEKRQEAMKRRQFGNHGMPSW